LQYNIREYAYRRDSFILLISPLLKPYMERESCIREREIKTELSLGSQLMGDHSKIQHYTDPHSPIF
jgi:hypothetical protein